MKNKDQQMYYSHNANQISIMINKLWNIVKGPFLRNVHQMYIEHIPLNITNSY